MKTSCVRNGQTEIGLIEHEGQTFAAMGASVNGRHVAGYLGKGDTLTTFCGKTMLDVHSERHGDYYSEPWGETFGIIFYLPRGRAIVGYCLGENCLFRGELIETGTGKDRPTDARNECRAECEHWVNVDAEDDERFRAELREEEEAERREQMLADLV